MPTSNEIQNQLKSIEALVHRIEKATDPALSATAKELVQLLMELHGAGLERMLEIVDQPGASAPAIIEAFGRDDLVRSLLLLYGLHPDGLEARVLQALEKTRPYLKSHGGNVSLIDVSDSGAVTLRLEGNCHGCPSSSATLKLAVEEAIYEAAPDVTAIIVQGSIQEQSPAIAFVPLSQLGGNSRESKTERGEIGWEDVFGLDAIPSGTLRAEEVGGHDILFCRLEETLYAYNNTCPGCSQPLGAARLEGTVLACPICSQHYDVVRAGRGVDLDSLHLEPVPLLRENGRVKLAMSLSKAHGSGL
ncbi:MAG TPA: NifU family protein [Candidatus Acidoferrales bacterium]|jgi:Fe-S cluster biogenesis protein NfuA/nitrite reductase/ring-hydroxylating ferredoxin subunit|nr:NifU family protein [Candidatus Acidoferrales bacterium]